MTRLKSSSLDDLAQMSRNHIIPFFEDKKLNEIYASDIDEFILHLQKKKSVQNKLLSGHTINKVLYALHGLFEYAILDQRIEKNPVNLKCHKVKEELKGIDHFSLDEMNSFLCHVHPEYKPFFILLWHTGMRIGEAIALKWQDVNFKDGTITVQRQMYQKTGHDILDVPKTQNGIRKIFMTQFLVRVLLDYKQRLTSYRLDGFIFERDGKAYRKTGIVRSQFKQAVRKAGLRDSLRPHSIRHSLITIMRMHFPDFVVRTFIGHSTKGTFNVTDRYTHLSDSDLREYAIRLGAILTQEDAAGLRKSRKA
jgi:integrase